MHKVIGLEIGKLGDSKTNLNFEISMLTIRRAC